MSELSSEPQERPAIAVVVCTHNRAEKLANCLAALADQSLDRSSYEIVVVDDCSSDETPAVAERYADCVVRNQQNLGLAASRNVGVAATTAALVAFTDDDCVPGRDWLREVVRAFEAPEVLGVGGKIVPVRTDRLLLRYYAANNPLAHNPYRPRPANGVLERFGAYLKASLRLHSLPESEQPLFTITGANMGLRRSTFDLVGGFDESYRLAGEDTDLWLRLRAIRPEASLRYRPRAVVGHDYDPSIRDAFRRNRSYGRAAGIDYLQGRGRLPAIFPFPIMILSSFALAAISLALLAVPFVLLVLLYPGWLWLALKKRSPAYVGFSVLQAAFELQTTIGFVGHLVGISSRRLARRSSRARRP